MKSIKKLDFNIRKTEQIKISDMVGKFALGLVVLCCLTFVGCSKDAEINSFLTEWETVTSEIVQKIDADPSSAGVDDAQKTWNGKKAGLKAKWDKVKTARGFQVSQDTQKKMEECAKKNMAALTAVMSKNVVKLATDKSAADKFKNLLEDYGNTFRM
jgi:biopolymer transport protein ExbB/TolQ